MAGEWSRVPLGDLVQNFDSRRIPLSSREREKRRGPYPYYGATGVMDYVDDYLFEGLHLLIAEDGSVETANGKPFLQLVDGKFWVNNHAHVLRAATDSDTKFLYYALSTIAIRPYMSGSVQAKLSQANMNRIPVPYPPDERDRRAIAHILGTLDDKIELNRRMSETLEATARALFESWFVRFDPVRRNMARKGRGQPSPAASRHPLPLGEGRGEGVVESHAFDHLFPDRLVDSELGEIPEGWEVWCVRDIGNVVCGKTPSTKIPEYYGDDVPFITIPDMHGNIFVISTQKKLSHVGASSQARKTLPAGSICVSCIATPGLVVITTEESQTNQQINSVIPNQPGETYYWFWVLRDLGNEIKAGGSGGSVLTNLSTGRFSELRILACNRELRRAYHSHVVSIFEKILTNLRETKALAALRDALLPKLISGELRVKDAERFLKERGI